MTKFRFRCDNIAFLFSHQFFYLHKSSCYKTEYRIYLPHNTPSPQVTEHGDQIIQSDHPPSTVYKKDKTFKNGISASFWTMA